MDSDSPERRPSFRDRLANIPDADDDEPLEQWAAAQPPVVAPPASQRRAPVARPSSEPPPSPRPTASHYPTETAAYAPVGYAADEVSVNHGAGYRELAEEYVEYVPRRRRRRWPLVLFFLLAVAALAVVVPLFVARQTFNGIERVPVADSLQAPVPAGRNILLVGTDSRDGIDTDTENAGVILGEGDIGGERTDTIMVLRLEESGAKFLSLPRDLWLPIDGGGEQRINTAYRNGPAALVNTVRNELGLPISHFVEVDLAGFIEVVDAVGGVEVVIEHPAFDRASGLDLPVAGPVVLDSTQALAWVRSRRYTEVINGQEVVDGTSDLGRVARQQEFMRALLAKLAAERNPLAVNSLVSSLGDAVALDDVTSLADALTIANAIRSSTPQSIVLPTTPDTRNGNSVLLLADGASEVLRQFGATPEPAQ